MNKAYEGAISEYNLRELKRQIHSWDNKSLSIILSMDIMQVKLLKRIVAAAVNKEDQ